MTNEYILGLARDLLLLIAGGLSGWLVQNIKPKQERADKHDEYQNKTIEMQGKLLSETWEQIDNKINERLAESDKKIASLEAELIGVKGIALKLYQKMEERKIDAELTDEEKRLLFGTKPLKRVTLPPIEKE